jgi:hypothetical protein
MKPLHAAGGLLLTVILYSFTGLRGNVDTCKWFDDNLNTDRSEGSMIHQTDLLYNRIALPPDEPVTVRGTAVTDEGGQLVDFDLHGATICSTAEAVYGPTPSPSPAP